MTIAWESFLSQQRPNVYMRLMDQVECEIETIRLKRSAKVLDIHTADEYVQNLLAVRDTLSAYRQQEMAATPTG